MAEAGLQPLQLSVVQELYVPFEASQADLSVAQATNPDAWHPLAAATPSLTHLKQVSKVEPRSEEGHVPVAVPTLHLRANADAIMRVARAAI